MIQIAKEMGIEVRKQMIPREGLYIADEVFFTGSAAEITPIRSVDHIKIGNGRPGPVSRKTAGTSVCTQPSRARARVR